MAEKRMFAKSIIDSDAFIDMSITARLLYYDLGMRADDDGFVGSPKKIMRMVGCSEDDLKLLIAKGFIIPFNSGVVVITHWKLNNTIQKDRYKASIYTTERSLLTVCDNGVYSMDTDCIQNVSRLETQIREDKDRLVEDSKDQKEKGVTNVTQKKKVFVPPSVEEVRQYCKERGNKVDPEAFVDFYSSKGWMVGKNHMKDWRAAVRTWERSEGRKGNKVKINMDWEEGDDWLK